jgi:hypothetical protein
MYDTIRKEVNEWMLLIQLVQLLAGVVQTGV